MRSCRVVWFMGLLDHKLIRAIILGFRFFRRAMSWQCDRKKLVYFFEPISEGGETTEMYSVLRRRCRMIL